MKNFKQNMPFIGLLKHCFFSDNNDQTAEVQETVEGTASSSVTRVQKKKRSKFIPPVKVQRCLGNNINRFVSLSCTFLFNSFRY